MQMCEHEEQGTLQMSSDSPFNDGAKPLHVREKAELLTPGTHNCLSATISLYNIAKPRSFCPPPRD